MLKDVVTPVRLEPAASWSRVKHSTTELPRPGLCLHILRNSPGIVSDFSAQPSKWLYTLAAPSALHIQQTSSSLKMNCTKTSQKFLQIKSWYMGLVARKPVFGGLRTTKAQTSLPIRAVWSAPLLFAFLKAPYLSLLQAKSQFSS